MARARTYRHDLRCPHCGSNWTPKAGHSRGQQTYRCGDGQRRFTPGPTATTTLRPSSTKPWICMARVPALPPLAPFWEFCRRRSFPGSKKARRAQAVMAQAVPRRTSRRRKPAAVIAFDEMWSYVEARRKGLRREVRIWMAVVAEAGGSRWVDFAGGDRSEETFLRLYERLPPAELYRSDHCRVDEWLPRNRHIAGKGGAVSWNEGTHSIQMAGQAEPFAATDQRVQQAGVPAAGLDSPHMPPAGLNLIPARVGNTNR